MITIRGINGDILTHFDNDVPDGNPYFEPVLTDDMESLVSSFSFSVPLELADTEHLVGLNQVLVKDRQDDLRLFVITDVHEVWTTVGGTLQVNCEDISINEMNNIIVSPFESLNFQDTLTKTFKGSGWTLKYGANWKDVDNTTFKVENYDNMRSVIASIVDTYGCQFKFMAQENQFGEITRVAEVYKSRGNDTGKYFYYDRDLLGIERDINHADIKTAIHPYYTGYDGKTYSLKGFAPVNPDPDFKKDKESPLIINREASKLFDDGNSYRIMPYKTEVEGNPELVYREAIKELKKYAEPIYTYSVNVLLLQNMIGWEGENIDLGDTVWMKERVGNRELGLEARVTAYEYHEDDPSKDVVTFSNFKEIDTTDVPELAERIFIAYANSEDGIIDFSITDSVGKAYMGVYTAAVSTQSTDPSTYSWTRIKGEDGVSAPTLNLTSSQQVMKFNSDGTPDGDQTIIFTALKQNSTETVSWEAIPYKGDIAQPTITLGGTGDVRSLSSADWNNEWTRVKVTVSMGSLKDIQTVVMVSDGATGASGKAIVGYVTNESTTFAASSDGTVTDYGNGNGKFVLYEGTNEVTSGITFARVSQVGINLLINDTTGEYKVSNMTTDMAQASVSATYKGITITKFLSFSKSKQGAKGDKGDTGNDGIAGKDGVGLKSTGVTYAGSASGTTPPSTGWQAQVPTVPAGQYLWTKTVWTYTDNSNETGYSVARMGQNGNNGKDGIAGKDGVGINDTLIEYAVNTSGTTRPTSGWSTSIPTVPQGQYLWTRTTWTYTDHTTEQGFTVARQGEKGDKGDKGDQGIAGPKGADGKTQYTHIAYADNASGGGFSQNPTGKAYIGMYVDFEELDSSDPKKYAWSLIKGADGEQGVAGPKGEDGRTPYFHTAYTNSTDFGAYDYSGNPNLMNNLDFSKISSVNYTIQTPPPYVKDGGTFFVIDRTDPSFVSPSTSNVFIPLLGRLEKGAHYVVTIPMMVSEDFGTDYGGSPIYPYNVNDGVTTTRPWLMVPNADCRGKWQFIKKAFTVPSDITDGKFAPFLHVYQNDKQTGKFYIGYDIKIEKVTSTSDTATPYQPNLLDAPYYLSKVALGENIITSKSYDNSNYLIGSFDINKTINNGDKLTFTIQGTKPANKQFGMYIQTTTGAATEFQGHLTPVEGLTDVWSWSSGAKISKPIGSGAKVVIYQLPPESQVPNGKCTILWAKLEKGDTRTPNIDYYKYLGNYTDFVQADSLNPTKYSWSLIKGSDGETSHVHTAYAWSADGTDRFTKVYPQVNMLENTKNPTATRTPRIKGSTPSGTDTLTFQNGIIHHERKTIPANGEMFYRFMSTADGNLASTNLVKGETYYFGLDLRAELAEGDYVTWRAQYKNPISGWIEVDGWKTGVSKIEGVTSEFKRFEKALTIPKDAVTLYFSYQVYPKSGTGVAIGSIVEFKNAKFALKSAAPYTPTPEEDYENAYPSYTGTYSDFNVEGSDNPKDYAWVRSMGNEGQDGAPAKALTLQADSPVMKFDANDVVVAGQVITFTAFKQNFDSNIAWVATPYKGNTAQPAIALKGTGDVRTLEASMWASGVTTIRVDVSADTFRDSVTITKVKDGAKGDKGSDGIAGKDGVGIRTTAITYAGSASGTTPPTTGWQTQVPTVPAGQFLWTKTVWTYTDNSTETGYSAAMMGKNGAKGDDGIAGKDGVGIKTTLIKYAASTSGTVRPTSGWSWDIPAVPEGNYLWTRTTWTYTDNTTEQGFTVARQGSNGQNGTNGTNGIDAYSAILSNEANTFAANPAGAVTDWSTGRGTFMVYRGTTRLTSGVTYAVASSVDASGTINATTGDYSVTALAKDNGSITFKATIGSTVLTKTMSLSKARQGAQGVQGTMGIAFYSPTEPTGANVKEGSTWFKTVSTSDNTIAGIYTYKGGKWVKTEVASGALAVEKLSALSADLGDVTAGNITGVNITGASFVNPFDFTDVSMNHFKGTTEIADAEIGLEGIVNEGTAGARKFVNSITPAYFQSVHKDASGSILRSVNTSSSGIILNDSNVTTSFDKDGLRVVDKPRNASSWSMSTRIGLTRGSDGSTMEMLADGPVLNNRKNIHVWQGTGTNVKGMPNLGRITFGTYQSIGWGMINDDIPLKVHNSYTWQAKRKIKLEIIAQVNTQDPTADWVYFTAQSAMTTATDKSPRQVITIGRISATKDSGDIRIPLQNTTLCTGYFELNEGEYLSLCGNCRDGKHCGNVTGMSIAFREIFST